MGRDMGVEPIHVRFTAGCVHRFTNRASGNTIYFGLSPIKAQFGEDLAICQGNAGGGKRRGGGRAIPFASPAATPPAPA